jgi:hypothetical protein
MPDNVYKIVELVGSSEASISKAIDGSNSHYDNCSQFLNPGSVHRALKLLHQAVRNSEKNPTA